MRVNSAVAVLLLGFATVCCVTQKAQKIQDSTQAKPANAQSVKRAEQVTPTDAPKMPNEVWLEYEPTVVELKGKLITKMFYGPPNYGENPDTDSKEEFAILVLRKPVNVHGIPDSYSGYERMSVNHVREMQLVLRKQHKDLIGKEVTVKGTIFHANTGHHHTAVLMDVQSIKVARSD